MSRILKKITDKVWSGYWIDFFCSLYLLEVNTRFNINDAYISKKYTKLGPEGVKSNLYVLPLLDFEMSKDIYLQSRLVCTWGIFIDADYSWQSSPTRRCPQVELHKDLRCGTVKKSVHLIMSGPVTSDKLSRKSFTLNRNKQIRPSYKLYTSLKLLFYDEN